MTGPQIFAAMTVCPWVFSFLAKQSQFLQLFLMWQHGFWVPVASLSSSSERAVISVCIYVKALLGEGMPGGHRKELPVPVLTGITPLSSVQGWAELALWSQGWLTLCWFLTKIPTGGQLLNCTWLHSLFLHLIILKPSAGSYSSKKYSDNARVGIIILKYSYFPVYLLLLSA